MTTTTTQAPATSSRAQVQAQSQNEVARQRDEAEQQARQRIDPEAAEAVEETRRALQLIADGNADEALRAIERATGRIDVLTARNPQAALLPVRVKVKVIDTAPLQVDAIRDLAAHVEAAVLVSDFPLARVLLGSLISEIRIRTFHLPLATYPVALREAAKLLDQHRNDEAAAWLQAALNTLVAIDRVIPLPLVLARLAINTADSMRTQDREMSLALLDVARIELDRAMELGYMGKDQEYKQLNRAIRDLEKQLRNNENTTTAFAQLKDRLAAFVQRITGTDKSSRGDGGASRGDGAAGSTAAAAPTNQQGQSSSASA
jgi:hypothetical protein